MTFSVSDSFSMRLCMREALTGLSAALILVGCASVGSPGQSSLDSAELLTLQADGTRAWRAPAIQLTAFHLTDEALAMGPDLKLDGQHRAVLRKAFGQALARALRDAGLRQASSAGAGVVSVRGTVTAVELANPALNGITTLLVLAPLSRGGVSIEVEAWTGENNVPVAALSFRGQAGVTNVGSAFTGIGHAELQTELAARKFADLLLQRASKLVN